MIENANFVWKEVDENGAFKDSIEESLNCGFVDFHEAESAMQIYLNNRDENDHRAFVIQSV